MAVPQSSCLCLSDSPSEWLNKLLYRDNLHRDLTSTLELEKCKVCFSGTRELDYPVLNDGLSYEIEATKSFPLPPDLIEKFSSMQTNCLMGVFTLCEKVWVTIDNEIFMWNFEDGEDLAYYDGVNDTIISVSLIVPSVGTLPEHIKFLLCLATPSEIWLLGMMYSNTNSNHTLRMQSSCPILEVMPDPLYCLPTENNYISCIESTPNGRIFLGTREGFLLEMTYSSIPNWDGDSLQPPVGKTGYCTLVNHSVSALSLLLPSIITSRFHNGDSIIQLAVDTSRHLLYSRTEDSHLVVYEFSDKISGSFSRLSSLSASDLAYQASCIVRSVDKNQFRNIVSIIPLTTGLCYLLAITKTGIRLYFGENLRLLHIRLPPSSPYDTIGLSDVKLAVETRGTVIMVSAFTQNNLVLDMHDTRSAAATLNQSSLNMSLGQFFTSDLDNSNSSYKAAAVLNQSDDNLNVFTKQIPPHVIYTISPDLYPWTLNLTESFTTSWCVDGGAWALTVLPDNQSFGDSVGNDLGGYLAIEKRISSFSESSQSEKRQSSRRGEPPVVLTQILDPPFRRLLLISAQGVVHFRLANPLTRLREYLSREFSNASLLLPGYGDPQLSDMIPNFPNYLENDLKLGLEGGGNYLSAFLHQFSPDEAICTALAIGASATVSGGLSKGLQLVAEQTALYFAAKASQYWTPAIIRTRAPNLSCVQSRPQLSLATSTATTRSTDDKSINSALHLFSGICLFLARIARSFWRYSMFYDATSICSKCNVKSISNGGLRSWVRSLIYTLSTVSTFGGGKSNTSSVEQIIISRLETSEISWLRNQIIYLQQLIQRQLNIRGGWFRLSPSHHSIGNVNGNIHLESTLSDNPTGLNTEEYMDEVALQRLAEELHHLLSMIAEILGFWEILSEHVVHKIMKRLSSGHRDLALKLTIEAYISSLLNIPCIGSVMSNVQTSLIGDSRISRSPISSSVGSVGVASATTTTPTGSSVGFNTTSNHTGTEVIGALITALIEYYLVEASEELEEESRNILSTTTANNNLTVETITSRLQSTCPRLFANEDAMCAKASECLIQASIIRTNLLSSINNGENLSDIQYENGLSDRTHIDQLISEAILLYSEAGPSINLDNAVHRLESCGAWRGAVKLCLSVARSRDPSDIAVDCLKRGRRPSSDPLIDFDHRFTNRSKLNRLYAVSELAATEGRYDAYRRMTICLDHLLHAAQIKSDATYLLEPISTTTINNNNETILNKTNQDGEEYPFNINELSNSLFILNELNDLSSPQLARSILQIILMDINKSDDILAHFEVFNWLLSNGLTDTVMLLNSAHFEAYLRSRLRQTPDDANLRCLLWRLLERRGARLEAAQVLEHLAVTPCHQLTLEDRLDFAARAIVAVKALPASQQDLDYLRDLEVRLELAQLQQMLTNELKQLKKQLSYQPKRHQDKQTPGSPPSSSPSSITRGSSHISLLSTTINDDIDEALGQLTHGPLLSVTEMFANYADRFGLHESKLFLLWASGSQDSALIKAIWRDLLRKILNQPSIDTTTTTQSPLKRSPSMFTPYTKPQDIKTTNRSSTLQLIELTLQDCLSRFGSRFLDNPSTNHLRCSIYFPLTDIISTLEYYAIQHSLNPTWVPTILRDSHLLCISNISDAYNELIHSKDSLWRRDELQERLFIALITIIEDFLTNTSIQLPLRQRMLQADRILNQITGLLVDLNSDITSITTTNTIITSTATTTSNMMDKTGHFGKLSKSKWIECLRNVHDRLQRLSR
ncbi:putative nuclear pore complex protein nup155 [Schistosoma mansoni]|uniref:putative nuclear pore complex protein nup155 n=1 Tax=Schistosoma mansoni TaxID=6183 RepID=UPI00022DC1AE|nr:putative nuclear pore complex protein nup155 [Schistosoma mansoni]|eukprot:XP_018652827.1 putative nuclear pore complex protein nup155 [Schistosoma mansoni]